MRLFMTQAGTEAWYAALVRNVRLEITRFEIGAADVYTLSGAKTAKWSIQQFRDDNYTPSWVPDFSTLVSSDPAVFNGTVDDIGFWKVRNNDGGLIFRVPYSADPMAIGNVRVYAKNTGPYPYPTPGSPAYRQYQHVYSDELGGEVLLFAGFTDIASTHWASDTQFPNFTDVRIGITGDGLFNNLDSRQFAFEDVLTVFQAATEIDLKGPSALSYGAAIVQSHTNTNLPAMAFRVPGSKHWVGYPLVVPYYATLEAPVPVADSVLDDGTLDHGSVDPPPPIISSAQQTGVVIAGQPQRVVIPPLAFTVKDEATHTASTSDYTVSVLPNTAQPYFCRVTVADFAFLGRDQELYFVHNGSRYRLCANNRTYSTPIIQFNDGDIIALTGTLHGPISSLVGSIYASLNEAPVTTTSTNKDPWLLGKVSMHLTSTVPCIPDYMNYGLTGRRISGFSWDETTPEQRVVGLGYDLYGISPIVPVTIRVKISDTNAGGIGYSYGAQETFGNDSYLDARYVDPTGSPVIRTGVYGLSGTALHVLINGTDAGIIATPEQPEGTLSININANDRISFRAVLVGQAYNEAAKQKEVLPTIAVSVTGTTVDDRVWLGGDFDLAATFGPDISPPVTGTLPTLAVPSAITNKLASQTFSDYTTAILSAIGVGTATLLAPVIVSSGWVATINSPNPTISADTVLTLSGLVVTGTVINGYKVELERYDPLASDPSTLLTLLANNTSGLVSPITFTFNPTDLFRIKVTLYDPALTVNLSLTFTTELGTKTLTVTAISV